MIMTTKIKEKVEAKEECFTWQILYDQFVKSRKIVLDETAQEERGTKK